MATSLTLSVDWMDGNSGSFLAAGAFTVCSIGGCNLGVAKKARRAKQS
jgi:hypothetical protein